MMAYSGVGYYPIQSNQSLGDEQSISLPGFACIIQYTALYGMWINDPVTNSAF
jgi:hypothetical protein